jgi:sRNA-binding carbon storage regulator CsrA
MLILTRRVGQSFIILPAPGLNLATTVGELFSTGPIEVAVTQVSGMRVRISVAADQRLLILRAELRRHCS